jgi:sigma-B regulation protein RsbU (phosphoserine phosphatase)
MTLDDLEHFKTLLVEREKNLVELLNSGGSTDSRPPDKVQHLLVEIKDALARVELQTFGRCTDCDGEVEKHRLEVQPTSQVCLGCISKEEQRTLEEELYLASRVHRALLPQTVETIDGFDVAAKSLAAHQVGGDYYDFLPVSDGGTRRVVIADIMGKGLPAGLIMSNMQGALRILAEECSSPGLLINRVNRWLCRNVPVTKFISLTCIAIESGPAAQAELTYANAGHCPTIILRTDGSIDRLEATGTVLGVHEDLMCDERSTLLHSGDLLVLYTDGVTEARNSHDEMFEEERLIEFVSNHRSNSLEALLEGLIDEVKSFSESEDLADDLTVIALRKK